MFALSTLCMLAACTDDAIETAPGGSRLPLSLSVVQDWDTPTFSRPSAKAPSALENTYRTVGTLNGDPLFVYSTEVEGISAYDLRTSVKSGVDGDYSTRGVLKHSSSFHDNFNVYSSIADNGTTVMTPDGGTNWYLNRPLHWDGDNPATFYGVAPQGTYSGFTAVNPVITYVNPDTAVHQVDLMVSKATGKQSDSELPFPFHHILSAVKVKIGPTGLKNLTNDLKIVKLEIDGIYKQGTYNVESGTWTLNTSVKGKVTQQSGWEFSLVDKGVGENLMVTNDVSGTTFLVVPQTLPSTAKLKVTFKKGSSAEQTVEASLTGTWQKGYTKTYVISSKDEYPGYVLEIENDSLSYKHNGNTVASGTTDRFRVKSYKNDISKTAVPWSITGYASGDGAFASTNSTFATAFSTTSGTGGQTGEVVSLSSVAAQVGRKEYHDFRRRVKLKALYQSEGTKGGDGAARFDLSAYQVDNKTKWTGNVRNSANCYIVRYPGKYKIPLIIGNILQNDAFVTYGGTDYETFTNYAETPVHNQPYRYMLRDAVRAELLWEDSKELISIYNEGSDNLDESVPLNGQNLRYIYFDVNASTMRQGNAVICVKNSSGLVMWCYHIYITDRNWVDEMVPVKGSGIYDRTYDLAPEPLGYIELTRREIEYKKRHMRLQITQSVSNNTGKVRVQQIEYDDLYVNPFGVHYQWGRKDAFPGIDSCWVKYDVNWNLIPEQLIQDPTSDGTPVPGRLMRHISQGVPAWDAALLAATKPIRGLSWAPGYVNMSIQKSIRNPLIFIRGEGVASATYGWMNRGSSPTASWRIHDYTWNNRNSTHEQTKRFWDFNNDLGTGEANFCTTRDFSSPATCIGKTIYDPCPPGFTVSAPTAFHFTTKKAINDNTTPWNTVDTETAYWNASSKYSFDKIKGFFFYTTGDPSTRDSLYIPCLGNREFYGGKLGQLDEDEPNNPGVCMRKALYYTSQPYDMTCAVYFAIRHPMQSQNATERKENASHYMVTSRAKSDLTVGLRVYRAAGLSIWPMKGFIDGTSW